MPSTPGQSAHYAGQQQTPSSASTHHHPMGRSQSAFNFLLSKAKAPFSSSSGASGLNASTSLSSLNAEPEQVQDDIDHHLQYHRQLQTDHAFPHAPPPIATRQAGGASDRAARSSTSETQVASRPSMPFSKSSYSEEASASPSKKGFFAGMGRDKKPSSSSSKMPAPQRPSTTQSPLTKGLRLDASPTSYAQFSKSQSDLHAKSNISSPNSHLADLPRVPGPYQQHSASADRSRFLRSPSPAMNFSRSVDDLSSSIGASSSPFPSSPGHDESTAASSNSANWGEQGIAAQGNWRPSDVGTIAPAPQQPLHRPKAANGKLDSSSQIPTSTALVQSSLPTPGRSEPKHSRKLSKLTGKDITGRGVVASSLAATLGLTQAPMMQASFSQSAAIPVTLPHGASLQGFLSRNANISLSVAQLNEHDSKGKDREKDIAKGWKPYRVVLQDGKLLFYKPSSNYADEVKALFPTSVLRHSPLSGPGSQDPLSAMAPDALIRGGLSKSELLMATSKTVEMPSSQPPPTMRSRPSLASSPSNKVLSLATDTPTTGTTTPRAWAVSGKHPELVLVQLLDPPKRWVDRILSGTIDALANEFVRGTQIPQRTPDSLDSEEQTDAEAFALTVLCSSTLAGEGVNPDQLGSFLLSVLACAKSTYETQEAESLVASKARLEILCETVVQAGLAVSYSSHLQALADVAELDSEVFGTMLQAVRSQHEPLAHRAAPKDWTAVIADHPEQERDDLRELRTSLSISDNLLLRLEPLEVAQQIQVYHAQHLPSLCYGQLTISEILRNAAASNSIGAFSFDAAAPHPITTLVLSHLLGTGPAQGDLSANTSQVGARHRASVLRHWIAIASYLLSLGDVAGWLAVSAALCSRALVRLEQTWRYLAEGDRLLVAREWGPVLSSLSWLEGPPVAIQARFAIHGQYAFVEAEDGRILASIPYLGNALCRLLPHRGDKSVKLAANAEHASNFAQIVSEWQTAWLANPVPIAAHVSPLAEFQATLQLLFNSNLTVPDDEGAAILERSFQLEPKTLGILDLQRRESLPVGPNQSLRLVPLLFPQPLPVLSLLDATKISNDALQREDRRRMSPEDVATSGTRNTGQTLGGSPLVRSSVFSPTLGSKSNRNSTFPSVLEWSSHFASESSGVLRIGIELVLRVLDEPVVSLPNSPMMAKRFSQDFGRSPRPLSQISKRSSLPASNRNSVIDIVVPVQVVVKSATLDRMIDVLVMGVNHISLAATQLGSDPADPYGGSMRKSKLSMDLDDFRATFLATFRSLCSPMELFEQLRKRFAAAVIASKELAGAETFQASSQFPSWISLTPVGSHSEPTDWEMVYSIRMGVVLTLRLWIERFSQDFADDNNLYHAALSFLRKPDMQLSAEDPDQRKVLLALAQLRSSFTTCIAGANARHEDRSYASKQPVQITATDGEADFNFDEATAASLIEYLESIATVFFDKIIDHDLLVASEAFESQASSPTAWFAAKHGNSTTKDDDKPINSMYTLLDSLKSADTDVTLQQKLPAAVRDALAAQSLFRGWIAIHIIEAGIGLERRQERLLKLIDALWICRSRMARLRGDTVSGSGGLLDPSVAFREPTIGSFVESAIVSTLCSSESRIFLRAWQGVAVARGGKGEGLSDLFPKEIAPAMLDTIELSSTPDIGWILACLAEATTRTANEPAEPELIDFDKRRTIWAVIDGAMRVRPACNSPELIDLAGTRLKLMQSALTRVSWDRRAFKEDAASELRSAAPLPQPSTLRLSSSAKALSGVSKQQQEKLRCDRVALEALESALSGPSISSRMSSMPSSGSRSSVMASQPSNSAVQSANVSTHSPQSAPPDKAAMRSRRMTALFKGAVRPLMASEKHDVPARSVAELMRLTPLQKPSIVAGLGGAQVMAWNNTQRSFVFHLTSEEGAKYLLQAPSAQELNEWISQISKVAGELAPRLRAADVQRPDAAVRSKLAAVFGRPLREVVEREGLSVPAAMERMFAEVEARGLREVGIYRISGSKSTVDGLRRAWDQLPAEAIDLAHGEFSDIHTITGAVKTWLRELPDPVITHDSYDAIIATNDMENDDRLYAMRDIIWRLPKCHFDMLRRTAEHLARVVEEGEHNKMMSHNIGLIFGTSLLNPPPGPSSVAIGFGNIGKAANVVKTIVTMYEWLFEPEPEPELQVVAQPELQVAQVEADSQAEEPRAQEAAGEPVSVDSQHSADAEASDMVNDAPADEEEEGEVPELVEQPRRSGRRRPLTIVGMDSLGSHEQAMLRSCSEDNNEVDLPLTTSMDDAFNGTCSAPLSNQESATMPTIVLSRDEDGQDTDLASSSSSITSVGGADEAVGKLTASASLDDASENEGSITTEAVPRPANSLVPGGGYRDSIYSSYSLYADTLDNMKLESQTSASSMVAKRRSAMIVPSSTAPDLNEPTAK